MQTSPQAASVTPQPKSARPRVTSSKNPWPFPDLPDDEDAGYMRQFWLCAYMRECSMLYEADRMLLASYAKRHTRAYRYVLNAGVSATVEEARNALKYVVEFGGLLMAFPETTAIYKVAS